jgi:sulfur-carrier protein adenylyltransferase/sulfurtransferase
MRNDNFNSAELNRYSRHIVLPGFGEEAQLKLKKSKVLVVGAGGLGCPVLLYLTAAGVGEIGVIDFDRVSESNLQRQILFTIDDLGKSKAQSAVIRLNKLNPHLTFNPITQKLTSANALEILRSYHLVIDATDNFPTRYLVNDACVLLGIPMIYGAIFRYEGQVAVFNERGSLNYRDLYPSPPAPGSVPGCEQGGVLGVLAGIIGSIQASEAIKVITGIGEPLTGKLLILDSLTLETQIINLIDHHERNNIKKLIDYDDFCGINEKKKENLSMKEVTVQELKALKDSGADFQLIDVREPHEYDICNLDGELIPQAEIPHNTDKIATDKKVVIHCRSGARSGNMVQWLEKNKGYTNLYNLKGGILAWAKEIDTTMPTY